MKVAIPQSLPLLEYVAQQFDLYRRRPFSGYSCLIIAHLLGSTVPLLRMLEAGGIDKSDMIIVAKAYSCHKAVLENLTQWGYRVVVATRGYSPAVPYEPIIQNEIRNALESLSSGSRQPLLLLDDGGKGIEILHAHFQGMAARCKSVELTTRGLKLLHSLQLSCPVINVAKSWVKATREAPLIAQSMVEELQSALARWSPIFSLQNRLVAQLGYGAIGRAVAGELVRNGFNIQIHDPQPSRLLVAQQDGRSVGALVDTVRNAGLVVGCSGTRSLNDEGMTHLLPGTLLVNMASSDLEFEIWRRWGDVTVVYSSSATSIERLSEEPPWRCLWKISGPPVFYVANGGFPIDFSGAIDPIPPEAIQLTRALLLAGALQAINSDRIGITDLDNEFQHSLLRHYDSITSTEGITTDVEN